MNENIQALFQKVAESEELQSKFAKVSTPEEAYEVAKELQGGFTREEFLEAAKALSEAMNEDISDEELAFAAGGLDEPVVNRNDESLTLSPYDVSGGPIITRDPDSIFRSASKSAFTGSKQSKGTKAMAV